MRIREAAKRVGIAIHVLRHWDPQGVVVPARSASGHPDHSDKHSESEIPYPRHRLPTRPPSPLAPNA
ncbi:MerR family transcriptional regulator [Rhodococcus sp. Eu-32]|nr:MerR family transcriptional regulator [Rhodococcus sp. Eu-32]